MECDLDIGIIDIEIYCPILCVEQTSLEEFDNCPGKYVFGLGQVQMSVASPIEDSVSMALTAVHRMMSRKNLDYRSIGRLDVGTESSIDLSKSIKSHLMALFSKSGNHSVEGADNINACYGGTAALLNCLNWLQSKSWDGRLAMVVTSDIANYRNEDASARATSGAAAVCLLIGPNPALRFNPSTSHFMNDVYDFYKPICLKYPIFEGPLSISQYIQSLLRCAYSYIRQKREHLPEFNFFDNNHLFAFHCPYVGLVRKASMYLYHFYPLMENSEEFEKTIPYISNLFEKNSFSEERSLLEKNGFSKNTKDFYDKVKPSLNFSSKIGNSYCSSLFICLASILCSHTLDNLLNKKILLFSYGSGSLSSLYSFHVSNSNSESLKNIQEHMVKFEKYLSSRKIISPIELKLIAEQKKDPNLPNTLKNFKAEDYIDNNTFYLTYIDEKHRRSYSLHESLK